MLPKWLTFCALVTLAVKSSARARALVLNTVFIIGLLQAFAAMFVGAPVRQRRQAAGVGRPWSTHDGRDACGGLHAETIYDESSFESCERKPEPETNPSLR